MTTPTVILHIEDDPEIARAAKRWLRRVFSDAAVIHADNAAEATRIIERTDLDLILSDYDLGIGANGGAVLTFVRDVKPELEKHFVFFSASHEARRMIKQAGHFIEKPSEYEAFATVVRAAARGAAAIMDGEKLARCAGCRDDFYNGKNPLNVKRCWSFESAELVIRWRLGTWTQPTQPGAFTEVETLSCHHGEGYHHYKELPDVAIDPVRLRVKESR